MNLAELLLNQIDDPALSQLERAQLRCELAREMERDGNFEAAREALGELWERVGERPRLDELDEVTRGLVLLRAGSLSGWIGSARQIKGAQEIAKDLITESISIFERLAETDRMAEARIDLALCYWREGAFDEARVHLRDLLKLDDLQDKQRARALLNSAEVERAAMRHHEALAILTEAAPLFETSVDFSLKGKFHNTRALVLRNLGEAEHRQDYIDRALEEYTAASFYLEKTGHIGMRALVENNMGFLFFTLNRFPEAHTHLDCARRLFSNLKDSGSVAQVDDTRAQVFLAQKCYSDAEKIARSAVRTLEQGDEQAPLAEALTTLGATLARLGQVEAAKRALERAVQTAQQAGDRERACIAAIVMIEELCEHLSRGETMALYLRADEMFADLQHPKILGRLRKIARKLLDKECAPLPQAKLPGFVYATEDMSSLLNRAHRIAQTNHTVLITGETGTGKEVLARLVHEWSGRAGKLVAINCASTTEMPFDSMLFGHRRGSFAGAGEDQQGAAHKADGGTLFLDEIAGLSLSSQTKLLRLIEHGEIHTIGEPLPERVDVRVVATTSRDLKQEVARGSFLAELFYRLQTFNLEIPPLRVRAADIEALTERCIKEASDEHGKRVAFTPEAMEAIKRMPLRGNARELRSVVGRAVLNAEEGARVTAEEIELIALRASTESGSVWEDFSLKEEVLLLEERYIELALKETKGRVSHAAKLLGFKHHESLSSLIATKHPHLAQARMPRTPRKRSIIRKEFQKTKGSPSDSGSI